MENLRSEHDIRLRLELTSVPESVGLIRSIIGTVAQTAGTDVALIDDMRTAVSEACNNVVLHAYPDGPGPLIFSLAVRGTYIEAVVRDHGCGIRPGPAPNRGLGMGVVLINSLADRAEFESSEMGTELRMRFRLPVDARQQRLDGLSSEARATDPRASNALRAPSD